ncbi:D-lactate dehydrogenase [Alteromonas sp. 5E99-2]|uniref:D-lactate dehydrogenase n=1 Tax=Alteromonas sp. 5E99-2 TaxID=2817683 RepID=UPI001A99D48C|nr:D-lactate dehydrogenase [Alteromonas sp. 5E99-2]MBO1255122.1 D-lactate dehydrogenase [Alteromonas sp. 5E99-2]
MTVSNYSLINDFEVLLGKDKVATGKRNTEHFVTGWRSGKGEALAVVFPQTLLEFWQVLKLCVNADCIMVMQAANTGLTEGSTPSGSDYDRDVVVINTLAMSKLILLDEGKQVISLPGTTLHTLEKALKPLERSPHSVIGSSCLGASIVGGVANNSGGTLVKRGPAYTELSVYAWVNAKGELKLVNHLGIELGDTPEEILTNLENEIFNNTDIQYDTGKASATDYVDILRDVNANTPSRFNADPNRLYEASGCAGKIAVFAVRLDTFSKPKKEQSFYIGTNSPKTLAKIRKDILSSFKAMPEVGEYMHRDIFDVAQDYGKDTFLSVKHLGTDQLPKMFAMKAKIDVVLNRVPFLPNYITDRLMQGIAKLFPQHLPERMLQFRHQFEHHLILKMSDDGIEEARTFLSQFFAEAPSSGSYFECEPDEAEKAFLHRFAAAGAAIRYQTLNENKVGDILALDIALRRNDADWVEQLPEDINRDIDKRLYYGHFFCHVFHQDYVLKKGVDAMAVKKKMLTLLDNRGAKYPAEHNVGHVYQAEPALQNFYRQLDPTNSFNPGVGKMEKHKRNCACC